MRHSIGHSQRKTLLNVEALESRFVLSGVTFTVDPQLNRQAISRFIYGVNDTLTGAFSNLSFTRLGGNRWTAYNWENNASNAGSDWYYQNDSYLGGGATPGGAVIPRLQNASDRNAGTLITIPINGYVAADKNADGDVRNSGANYLQTRFRQEKAVKGSAFSLAPNLNDSYVYQDEFVHWVNTNFPYGQSDPNRPIMFSLDNEPDLWQETHPEIHPIHVSYAELIQKSIDYAAAIKNVAPGSKVFGPANYGWNGFVTLQDAPDANGRDFQATYLAQLKQAEQTYGKRLLDVLDVHWYPEAQGGGIRITERNNTAAVVAARLQAPRSLWDPTYTETSWITQWSTNGPINLIHRLESKIHSNYPGTHLAITEYNYGGGDHISGGIAQADALGIFGREGIYAANQWKLYDAEPYVAGGFAMFRNYDGNNGSFGDISIAASTSSLSESSIYASVDSKNPNLLTLVAINKTGAALPATFNLKGVSAEALAKFYVLSGTSSTPQAAGQSTVTDPSAFVYSMPAYSVTTIRLDLSNAPPTPTLSINDVPVTEGNSRTTPATFTVTLSSPSTSPVTVSWATVNGTATTNNADYQAVSGTLTLAPGQTSKTVTVLVNGDTQTENHETFFLRLSQPTGATLSDAEGVGLIRNDDRPTLTVSNPSLNEGNGGTTNAVFTLTLSVPTTQTVRVAYATANGTATSGSDYSARSGTVTFAPGEMTKMVNVPVLGDTLVEPNETFKVLLSSAVNVTLGTTTATATILNDDNALQVAVSWTKPNDWGNGFLMDMKIKNNGTTAINGWTLEFDLEADITNLWNGVIVTRVGNRYTVRAESWNPVIAANGGEVSFGFVANNTVFNPLPRNLKLNGVSL